MRGTQGILLTACYHSWIQATNLLPSTQRIYPCELRAHHVLPLCLTRTGTSPAYAASHTPMSTSSYRLPRRLLEYAYCRGHTISVFVERFPVKRGYVPKLRTEYAYSSRLLSAAFVTSGLALGSKSM